MKKRVIATSTLACALTLLVGCATIPTGGSVNHYANPIEVENASPSATSEATAPAPGATAEEIIDGFLHAGAGSGDNFAVARQYLTPEMADQWQPDERTLVYSASLKQEKKNDSQVLVTVPVTAKIDSRGIATSYSNGAEESLDFQLVQIDGEWRIKSAPQGLVLSQREFNDDFGPYTLYFYDPSYRYLVPDIRWLASRSATVTSLVRLSFDGPAPYLKDATLNATTQHIALSRNSVPVNNGQADVNLSTESSGDLLPGDIDKISAQLRQTLNGVLGVEDISISVGDKQLNSTQTGTSPTVNPDLPQNIVAIGQSGLSLVDNPETTEPTKIFPVSEAVTAPSLNYSTATVAALDAHQTKMMLGTEKESTWVLSGNGLTRPSFDHFSWAWTADNNGVIHAVSSDQTEKAARTIGADWLQGIEISSLSISRDGTRAVISGRSGDKSQVWVAGIIRDSETYAPLRLGEPVRVESGSDTRADWLDESRIVVADRKNGSVEIVSLSGEKEYLRTLRELADISVGLGEKEILATDADGNTYRWASNSWEKLTTGLQAMNFSG